MEKQRIGFVGLGLMGKEMTRNLLAHGFPVAGFDIDESKIRALIQAGGKGIEKPEMMAGRVDVIMMSLPNSNAVNEAVRKYLQIFETGREGLILIDLTTADPFLSKELAEDLRKKGMEMLDATVSGGPGMFAEREVALMVGGKESVFRSCEGILSSLSKNIIYTGENGSGALMKLMVNLVGGLNRMVLAEALSLCKRAGLDQNLFLEVLRRSPHYSRSLDSKGRKMVKKEFLPPQGKLAFHLKDVRLMLELGRKLNFPLPLASLHAQALTSEVAKGRGEWDNTDIISFYEDLGNLGKG